MILRNDFQTPSTPSKSFPKVGVMITGYRFWGATSYSIHPIILTATHVDMTVRAHKMPSLSRSQSLSCWGLLQERQLLWGARCVFLCAAEKNFCDMAIC